MTETNLHDELAIQRVLITYCRNLDDQNFGALAQLFAPDCVFETMGQRLQGREEVRSFFPAGAEPVDRPAGMHVLANVLVDVEGSSATAESDWVMVNRDDEGNSRIALAGRYRDRFTRGAEGWLIAHRTVVALARSAPRAL